MRAAPVWKQVTFNDSLAGGEKDTNVLEIMPTSRPRESAVEIVSEVI
jgi:hypothetical protein